MRVPDLREFSYAVSELLDDENGRLGLPFNPGGEEA